MPWRAVGIKELREHVRVDLRLRPLDHLGQLWVVQIPEGLGQRAARDVAVVDLDSFEERLLRRRRCCGVP